MDDDAKKVVINDIIKYGKINEENYQKLDKLMDSLSDTYNINSNGFENMQVLKPKRKLLLGKLTNHLVFGTTDEYVKNNEYLDESQLKQLQIIAKS